ncbi:MAG TPA: LysR substrate-binding domain-containing protein [Myxococcaceae bacterium]|nr:LysR substrate-binding domain-containing protein [Myxococcaceae bacterium]
MSKVPLHLLPGFVAAARLRNLSRAAASLHLTVSALSHQMRGLEELLGQRLFDRGPRGLRLTPAGERLFGQVAPHLEAISAALTPQPARSPDALTLSVMPTVASSWLIPRLPAFTALHPEVELSLQSTSDLVDFEREEVDAALRFGPGGWPGLRSHLLFEESVVPVCSPELLRRFPQAEGGDFSGVPLLRDLGERWHAWFARFGGSPPARYVAAFDDTDALQRAAVEGMGVALGRLTMARPLLESGRLIALTAHRLPDAYSHYLVYPPRSEPHPALVTFRSWILEAASSAEITAPERLTRASTPRRHRRRPTGSR